MSSAVSLVIPTRNEPLLELTIERWLNVGVQEVIVVDDGGSLKSTKLPSACKIISPPRQGVCPSRDAGIAIASNDAVIVADAHTCPLSECDIVAECAEYVHCCPTHYCCFTTVGVGNSLARNTDPALHESTYYGARIGRNTVDSSSRPWAYSVHWSGVDAYSAIVRGQRASCGCPLGGVYLLSQNHYMNTLRRPWQTMRGWGSAEQTMSLINWVMGGELRCLSWTVGHCFRSGRSPYSVNNASIVYNQIRLNALLPQAQECREKALEHLFKWNHYAQFRDSANRWLNDDKVHEYADYISACHTRMIRDYWNYWEMGANHTYTTVTTAA